MNSSKNKKTIKVYTLGNPKNYTKVFNTSNKVLKTGRGIIDGKCYGGGCVFTTINEAIFFARKNKLPYIPYGLILLNGWQDVDTSTKKTLGYYQLLIDSEIFML